MRFSVRARGTSWVIHIPAETYLSHGGSQLIARKRGYRLSARQPCANESDVVVLVVIAPG